MVMASLTFIIKCLRIWLANTQKQIKKKIAWLLNNNNYCMIGRVGKNTLKSGEATKQGFTGDTLFNEFTEKNDEGNIFHR